MPRVTPKPKVAGFCAALWLDFTPALTHGSLQGEALVLGRKFSQTALAEMLGVTREAVNKQLKSFQDQGRITLDGGIIHIQRPADIFRNRNSQAPP